jgi:hypothetical protein
MFMFEVNALRNRGAFFGCAEAFWHNPRKREEAGEGENNEKRVQTLENGGCGGAGVAAAADRLREPERR